MQEGERYVLIRENMSNVVYWEHMLLMISAWAYEVFRVYLGMVY